MREPRTAHLARLRAACGSDSATSRVGSPVSKLIVDLGMGLGKRASSHSRPQLPRKEVIQPQLPLRLPCYDFVPVTSPTLGRCPLCYQRLAHGLQVLPAPMT